MKDAYYFSHDSNARNDQRIVKVRMEYGMEGYGIYFGIVEILREQHNYTLYIDDIKAVAFDLRSDIDMVQDIILNYNLFEVEGDLFYSKSLKRRMECLDEKRKKRADAGRKGGLATSKKHQRSSNATPLKESKVNKIKKDKSKVNNINKRQTIFEDMCKGFQSKYGEELINDFISYWTEPNKSNTKMKFEMQDTFDISRRLVRWDKNGFNNQKNGVEKTLNFKMPDGRNYLAYCQKCGKSDFYDPFKFNPNIIESKCCNAKILNEREVVNA